MSTHIIARAELRSEIEEHEFVENGDRDFVVASSSMRKLLDQVSVVAPHLRIATIQGQCGTGKYAMARLLYQRFLTRNPEIRQHGFARYDARDWLLLQVDPRSLAGFVYLDRVDLLGAPGQALLLRTLKDLDFRRPGRLAIIASCEADLRDLARQNQFLNELALRLTSVRFLIPPLRERKDDILPLANVFLERLCARYHLPPVVLTSEAIAELLAYHWPGNLHELSSRLESALVECSAGTIQAEDLALTPPDAPIRSMRAPDILDLEVVVHSHILHVLDLNRGNKLRTARQLGISRSTLYRLLDKHVLFGG